MPFKPAARLAGFGTSVSTAGDVDGNGYSDVIIGAPGFDNGQTNEGRAFVYHGSVSGPGASAFPPTPTKRRCAS